MMGPIFCFVNVLRLSFTSGNPDRFSVRSHRRGTRSSPGGIDLRLSLGLTVVEITSSILIKNRLP